MTGVGSPIVVAVVLADGDVVGEDVALCIDVVDDDVRDADKDDGAAGELDAHPLSTSATDSVRTGRDARRAQERGAGRGTSAVWRDRV